MNLTNKENCWLCLLRPGIPVAYQLTNELKDKRDNFCQQHWDLAHTPNSCMALIKKKEDAGIKG